MTQRAPRRERQDAIKNRERILASAQELFALYGVENVSMNRIAQEAEVGAGTLYRHFTNKSDVCFALIQDQITAMAGELAEIGATANAEPRATFETMILHYLRFRETKTPLFKGMEQATAHTGGPTQSPVYETLRQPFIDVFERAIQAGELDGSVDAALRADLLLTAVIGTSQHLHSVGQAPSLANFARDICDVFYPKPPSTAG